MSPGIVLRFFGCVFASFISFLVCMLIGSQILGPSVAEGWVALGSLGVVGAFGWAFWKWPARNRQGAD